MKEYNITIAGKEITIKQDDDGLFIMPSIITEFNSYGTATKPAHEPIVVARKPLSEKTVAENVLKYGTGGINIDESRVGFVSKEDEFESKNKNQHSKYPNSVMRNSALNGIYHQDKREPEDYTAQGRFPANFIHDGSEEVLKEFEKAGISKSNDSIRTRLTLGSFGMPNDSTPEYSDSGTPARFFKSCEFELEDAPSFIYQAKASKSERNEGCEELENKTKIFRPGEGLGGQQIDAIVKNSHPTVKPLKLMEYLVKLVTPKGGICLDPFMGSGTTAVACKKNGFKYLGFEKEAEYIKIINARLSSIKQKKLLEE